MIWASTKEGSISNTRGRKIQFGCGRNKLQGWENYDRDIDISKPLPFPDTCADYLFAEHVLEHLRQQDAWNFLAECYRILRGNGVIRIVVPDIVRLSKSDATHYLRKIKELGWGDGSLKSAIRVLIFYHGHQTMWTNNLLIAVLNSIGFRAYEAQLYTSQHRSLEDIERHWMFYGSEGKKYDMAESSVIEGIKNVV